MPKNPDKKIVTMADALVAIGEAVAGLDAKKPIDDAVSEAYSVCHASEDLDVAVRCDDWPEARYQATLVAAHAVRLLVALPGGGS